MKTTEAYWEEAVKMFYKRQEWQWERKQSSKEKAKKQ
ncbi:hypothetical protein IC3_05668 [Bacillus cereus VD142]|nr:hypothetical protein IC3_05668 [Bacillus cereus VD142]